MPNCVNTYLETLLTLILDQPWERIFSSHAKSFGLELGPWNAALEGFGGVWAQGNSVLVH